MSLWKIAWRSMEQRALASWLTAISVAFGVALVVAVLVIHSVVDRSFRRGAQGYDLIVGAKGSSLQLVLDTVFYLGQPVDTIPYSYYREFTEGRFVPAVRVAIPICTGHDYQGFRAVATTPEMFDRLTYLDNRPYEFIEGRNFYTENPFECVVGYTVARKLGIKIGQEIRPTGQGQVGGAVHEDEPFTVVGILAPTGTPNDRAIFLNLEGFFQCESHVAGPSFEEQVLKDTTFSASGSTVSGSTPSFPADSDRPTEPAEIRSVEESSSAKLNAGNEADSAAKINSARDPASAGEGAAGHTDGHSPEWGEACTHHDHGHHDHADSDEHRRLSAILVVTDIDNNAQLAMSLPRVINEEPFAQAVHPARVIAELFDGIVGNVQLLLLILAILVVIVAGIGIMVSIYNSMSERRHEIAIMRALGASRSTVMAIILTESILLSLGGGLLGTFMGHTLVGFLSPVIAEQTGVIVRAFDFQLVELVLIPGLIVLATIVGYLPAVAAYRTDVAKALIAAP